MAVKRRATASGATTARREGRGTRVPPITWQTASCTMTSTGLRLVLPVVASANRLWRVGGGRPHKARGVGSDERAAALRFARVVPFAGEVGVRITWVRQRQAGDLDNRAKATLDLLKGIAFGDDAAVVELHMLRRDDPTQPAGMYVDVWTTQEEGRCGTA